MIHGGLGMEFDTTYLFPHILKIIKIYLNYLLLSLPFPSSFIVSAISAIM